MLHDAAIRRAVAQGEIYIEPWDPDRLQPSSVDFTLSNVFCMYGPPSEFSAKAEVIDVKVDQGDRFTRVEVPDGEPYRVAPGGFVLASTKEWVKFPSHIAGRLEGKSSLARLGLAIHVTAGFFDPGFAGYPTLELVNHAPFPMRIYPGMPVAQMSFFRLEGHAHQVYGHGSLGSKYQDQGAEPGLPKYHLNFQEEDHAGST